MIVTRGFGSSRIITQGYGSIVVAVPFVARGGRGGEEEKRFDRIRIEDEELLIMMPCFVETMRKWR